ncbi:hypothetical protein WS83_24840 [Burkholderia sp. MSMB2042]|nr:hypothetical protein WS78_29355 [Burkholderia savannae]KVG44988.1 hypothetical protein WS77_07395 [Burkholderia sp. MSMB0265]KVG89978.1 hypothetical protein WS81_19630 [Burkholderia sp. MSMB2040]KVG96115.1 hypothetical protein WS82_02805 [Burkholderia sp. MSMB2041]KVG99742.1 hypothetical protein WS83_24840 [Burkholderia sp. MSMB2042]
MNPLGAHAGTRAHGDGRMALKCELRAATHGKPSVTPPPRPPHRDARHAMRDVRHVTRDA